MFVLISKKKNACLGRILWGVQNRVKVMVRKKLGVLFYESHAMLMFLETFSFSKKKFAK